MLIYTGWRTPSEVVDYKGRQHRALYTTCGKGLVAASQAPLHDIHDYRADLIANLKRSLHMLPRLLEIVCHQRFLICNVPNIFKLVTLIRERDCWGQSYEHKWQAQTRIAKEQWQITEKETNLLGVEITDLCWRAWASCGEGMVSNIQLQNFYKTQKESFSIVIDFQKKIKQFTDG